MPPTLAAPELLLPAGTLDKMRAAYAYGADAVYAGQPRYSMRARNNEFGLAEIETGIREARSLGKKFLVASNIMPHNAKVKTYLADMAQVVAAKPDALIMADPGLIMLVREKWPEMPIHLSVQANAVNYAAVKFWKSVGLTRVILSRELSLDEIAEIRQLCPDMEIEVFVHGALCIAYSGRCLLSGYFNHRDPNQGTCTNSCRWDYKVKAADETDQGDIVQNGQTRPVRPEPVVRQAHHVRETSAVRPEPVEGQPGMWRGGSTGSPRTESSNDAESPLKIDFDMNEAMKQPAFSSCGDVKRHPAADKVYLIEEKERPGQLMPIMEDEHGTYIMNSKDLRAVEHVEQLVKIGVNSLKIEGRTKSLYYVARTAQVYRQAIDDAVAGRAFDPGLLGTLESLANRGYTDGFYQRHHAHETQNYLRGHSESNQSQYVGDLVNYDAGANTVEVLVKNRFAVGDTLEILHPDGNRTLTLAAMQNLDGVSVGVAPGSGHRVKIHLGENLASMFAAQPGRTKTAMLARFL